MTLLEGRGDVARGPAPCSRAGGDVLEGRGDVLCSGSGQGHRHGELAFSGALDTLLAELAQAGGAGPVPKAPGVRESDLARGLGRPCSPPRFQDRGLEVASGASLGGGLV